MGKKGGRGGMFKELERSIRDTGRKWRKDPWGELGNATMNGLTGGMVGMDDGKMVEGTSIRTTDEWTGEISGRNTARAAGYETEKQIEEAETLGKKQREEEMLARYRADVQASRMTQASRDTGVNRSAGRTALTSNPTETLGSDMDKDILGA